MSKKIDLEKIDLEKICIKMRRIKMRRPKMVQNNNSNKSLKPQDANNELTQGLDVKRQGEWFFIPVKGSHKPVRRAVRSVGNTGQMELTPLELRAGNNRPNAVSRHPRIDDNTIHIAGKVERLAYKHTVLILKGWPKAVPDTSVQSFTLVGDVD